MPKSELTEDQWRTWALMAYAGFKAKGRGALVTDYLAIVSPTAENKNASLYDGLEEMKVWAEPDVVAAVESYDPEKQIVVIFRPLDGPARLAQASADDGPTPRQLYDAELKRLGLPPLK